MDTEEKLDLTSFEKAVLTLDEAVKEYAKTTTNTFVRDACIHRFAYTYNLCCKSLKRHLEIHALSPPTITAMTFPTLIRTGSEQGLLLNECKVWKIYRDMSSVTHHSYDEEKAQMIIAIIPDFLRDAQFLLAKLQEKIKSK